MASESHTQNTMCFYLLTLRLVLKCVISVLRLLIANHDNSCIPCWCCTCHCKPLNINFELGKFMDMPTPDLFWQKIILDCV